jgi:hypothetical protein
MSYEVVPEELRAHSSHLDGLMDRLRDTISAANTVSMADDAYGLLCAFMPPIINPMEQKGMEALEAAAEGVKTTADNVRATATQYQESDETNSQPFSRTLSR